MIIGWFLISIIFTPVIALIFLIIADLPYRQKDRIEADLAKAKEAELENSRKSCPTCAQVVNFKTGEGLYHKEDEPWQMLCKGCDSVIDVTGDI